MVRAVKPSLACTTMLPKICWLPLVSWRRKVEICRGMPCMGARCAWINRRRRSTRRNARPANDGSSHRERICAVSSDAPSGVAWPLRAVDKGRNRAPQSIGKSPEKLGLLKCYLSIGSYGVSQAINDLFTQCESAWFIRCPDPNVIGGSYDHGLIVDRCVLVRSRNRPERFFHCGATSKCHQIRGCIQRIHLPPDGCFLTRLASILDVTLLDAFSVLIQFHDLDGGPAGARDLDSHVSRVFC